MAMKTPSLTAAICTRDRPGPLQRALASLRAQAVPPHEILVVDNASADGATAAVVRDQAGARYVYEPTPGLDFARNRALREATGQVVAYLDDDAVADTGWTAALAEAFAAHPGLGVCTGRVEAMSTASPGAAMVEANGGFGRGLEPVMLPADAGRRLHGRRAPLIAWAVSVGAGCSLAVARDKALALGGFDEALDLGDALPGGGDHDMLWRMLMSGHPVRYEPRALAWHEHRASPAAAARQIAGHQRALVALLVKCSLRARGRHRVTIPAFLAWRLAKPWVRLVRRLAGRDPLPLEVLASMAWACGRGLWAYPAARREAARRRARYGQAPSSPIPPWIEPVAGALSGQNWAAVRSRSQGKPA